MRKTWKRTVPVLAAALSLSACAGGGGGGLADILGTVLGGAQPASSNVGQVVVRVESVDQRNQRIAVQTEEGQRGEVLYDQNTRVVYQQQEYPVTALERGDVVEMRIQETQQGYYTDYILVRQSVQQGQTTPGAANLVQASGTVRQVDYRRGWFDLETSQGVVTVTLPYNPPATVVGQFERLDRGDRVSLEGYVVANDRIELVRFR